MVISQWTEDIISYNKLNPYISQWYKISTEREYQEKTYQKRKNKSKPEKVTFNRKQTSYSLYTIPTLSLKNRLLKFELSRYKLQSKTEKSY